jgi:heme-degrading monooxygenase HmoA
MNTRNNSVVVINVFTPRPDALNDFIALQSAALPGLRAGASGARGSRLYRAEDGGKVLMLSVFDTHEDFEKFTSGEAFAAHRAKMLPLLEKAEPGRYQLVFQAGEV